MSGKLFDGIKETTTSTGLGDLVFAGAVASFRSFASKYSDLDVFPYSIRSATEFENGIGRYNSGANSISRLEVKSSSNADAAVNFGAGVKEVAVSAIKDMFEPIAPFPFSAAQCPLRVHAGLSAKTWHNRGFVTSLSDLSGNAHHSSVNNTNPPRYIPRGLQGLPAIFFNLGHRFVFPGVPQIVSPFIATVVGIGYDWGASGNSHLYNWAGNPIGFSAVTCLEFIYNGTLPAAHPDSQSIVQDHRTKAYDGLPAVFIHIYNQAASVNSVNNNRQAGINPGNASSGTTNSFTIGGDSSTGGGSYSRWAMQELFILNFAVSAAQETAIHDYVRANHRMNYQ